MHAKFLSRLGSVKLVAVAVLALPLARAAAPTDDFPAFESYVKVTGQAASISGNEVAFQKRTQQNKSGGAGIEDLHYTKEIDKKTTLLFDGRALSGTEDYLAKLNLTQVEFGSVDVGYKRFRTFYDGIGGFFPINQTWRTLNPENLHLDRGSFWAEAKLNLRNLPVFTLRYTNETRNGQKDSTIWGDTDNVGQPYRTLNGGLVGTNNNATVRKVTPSYRQLDEHHEALEGTVKQTFGKTTAQLTLLGDKSKKMNGLFVTRFPGETLLVTPTFTAITPAVGTAASLWTTFQNQVQQSTYDGQDTDTKAVTGTTVTVLSPKMTLRAAGSLQDVSSDFSGDRIIVSNTPTGPGFVGGQAVTTSYNTRNLTGNSKVKSYIGSLALEMSPSDQLNASVALRGEDRSARSRGSYDVWAAPNANLDLGGGVKPVTGILVPVSTPRRESSAIDEKSLTPVFDARYTGIKDVAIFASVSQKLGHGPESNTPPYNPALDPRVAIAPSTPANPINQIISPTKFYSDVKERNGDYSLGGNWRQSAALTLRAELFYKDNSYHSTGYNTNAITAGVLPVPAPTLGNNYQLDTQFRGTKFTATIKPSAVLTSTTRYIFQKGKMQAAGYLPTYPAYDSMNSTNHTICETIDWNPTTQFYAQANVNVVFNVISTAYPRAGSVAASGVVPANLILQNANNNYSTGSLVAGTALTKIDDLQFQLNAYRANNYNSQLALYTQPYGASAKEVSATVCLKHKFSDAMLGTAKVGYFDSKNDTTGGRTDFHGPLAYLAIEYRL